MTTTAATFCAGGKKRACRKNSNRRDQMKTSESLSKISAALLAAQKAITFASKDAKNPHFKSTYADLPSVIDAIKPALNSNGIVFIQTFSPSESGHLAVTTRLMHESGEWIEDTATIPLPKCDPQGYGSAATYGRRYSLAAITGLYQDDDDGNAASGPKTAPKVAKVTERQAESLQALAGEVGADVAVFFAYVAKNTGADIAKWSDIPATAYDSCISALNKKRAA